MRYFVCCANQKATKSTVKASILRNLTKIVTPKLISRLASKVKFNVRSTGQLTGLDFLRMLITQASSGREMTYSGLNTALSAIRSGIKLSNQALSKYFYKQSSVDFIRSVYEKVFLYQREKLLQDITKDRSEVLDCFNRILIQDSTFCTLNEKLSTKYKGSGGSASSSSLKIDVIHELKTATLLRTKISEGKYSDMHSSALIMDEVEEGDLVLRDLGYSKIDVFIQLMSRKVCFISRLHSCVKVYLNSEDKDSVDLGNYLKKKCKDLSIIDKQVYIGKQKAKVRLIAYKVPEDVASERRRKARRKGACQGWSPTQNHLNLCDYVILVTNIPEEMISGAAIGTIYRLRWNIELLFKTWKSQLNLQINVLKGHKQARIECFVYTILLLGLLTTLVHGWMKRTGLDGLGKEISLAKLTQWLVSTGSYMKLLWGSISKLIESIENDLRNIRKQKRRRKTTLERVVFLEPYEEKFMTTNF